MEGTMATATRTRRTRKAATTTSSGTHVQLATGRGEVHYENKAAEDAYPCCKPARASKRYTTTGAPVDCPKCLELATPVGSRVSRPSLDERTPTGDPYETTRAARRRRRNGTAQDTANAQAKVIIAEETAKVVAKRDEPVRLPKCSDEDFALAQQVRGLREQGRAWWAIAHELELPGSGPSVKQGKTGAAHARRLWEKAWGPTYKDTSVPRDTKAAKAERAITQPGKPYFTHDEEDGYVVAAVTGHEIEWVTRLGAGDGVVCSVQKAEVSFDAPVNVVQGPKGRVLKFYETIRDEKGIPMVGPLRSVYVDRIERVGR